MCIYIDTFVYMYIHVYTYVSMYQYKHVIRLTKLHTLFYVYNIYVHLAILLSTIVIYKYHFLNRAYNFAFPCYNIFVHLVISMSIT